ncbi:ubiquinone biosynthesis methyltransferase UbiE, partial [Rhizobium johnstonii]
MDIEGATRAASGSSIAPFEEGVAELYETLLVPILFEPYASEMATISVDGSSVARRARVKAPVPAATSRT